VGVDPELGPAIEAVVGNDANAAPLSCKHESSCSSSQK
jgi:hypothetical protein